MFQRRCTRLNELDGCMSPLNTVILDFSINTLSDLGDSSNLLDLLSRTMTF